MTLQIWVNRLTSFASLRLDALLEKKGDAMKTKIVSYTLDKLPPLTEKAAGQAEGAISLGSSGR
jgi:hypothetical protein